MTVGSIIEYGLLIVGPVLVVIVNLISIVMLQFNLGYVV